MKCPSCGYENRKRARFCQGCGAALERESITRPLPAASAAFAPLPEGALLHDGQYEVVEVRTANEQLNVYVAEDTALVRPCPNCQTEVSDAQEQFCPSCGADLSGIEPLHLRYRIQESADEQAFAVEAQLLGMGLEHAGLLLCPGRAGARNSACLSGDRGAAGRPDRTARAGGGDLLPGAHRADDADRRRLRLGTRRRASRAPPPDQRHTRRRPPDRRGTGTRAERGQPADAGRCFGVSLRQCAGGPVCRCRRDGGTRGRRRRQPTGDSGDRTAGSQRGATPRRRRRAPVQRPPVAHGHRAGRQPGRLRPPQVRRD